MTKDFDVLTGAVSVVNQAEFNRERKNAFHPAMIHFLRVDTLNKITEIDLNFLVTILVRLHTKLKMVNWATEPGMNNIAKMKISPISRLQFLEKILLLWET